MHSSLGSENFKDKTLFTAIVIVYMVVTIIINHKNFAKTQFAVVNADHGIHLFLCIYLAVGLVIFGDTDNII